MEEVFVPLEPLIDIDLSEPPSPGPDWVHLPGRQVFQNRKDGRLLLVPMNGTEPPSQWGLLA